MLVPVPQGRDLFLRLAATPVQCSWITPHHFYRFHASRPGLSASIAPEHGRNIGVAGVKLLRLDGGERIVRN